MSNTEMMDGLRYAIMETETKRGQKPEEVRMHGDMIDILKNEISQNIEGYELPNGPHNFLGFPVVEDASVYGYKIVTAEDKELEEMALIISEIAKVQGVTPRELLLRNIGVGERG